MDKTMKLHDGRTIPVIGFGSWRSDNPADSVYNAIQAGYRHIDTASVYLNQKEVGAGIKRAIDEGLIKRDELWVTSKLWLTNFTPGNCEKELCTTLSDLGLEFLDLYMPHWPCALVRVGDEIHPKIDGSYKQDTSVSLVNVWKELAECQKKGMVRSIGVSNFSLEEVKSLLDAGGPTPVVNQVEFHPIWNQKQLQKDMEALGIKIQAYCPLGIRPAQNVNSIAEPAIKEVAEKHGISPAAVVLQWHVKQGRIPLPKTDKQERLKGNLDIFSKATIDDEDLAKVDSILSKGNQIRTINPSFRSGKPIFH
eukprot:GHVP01053116.1.p2 GENE.GHVP01053116.1~~GHVP01053116.1.p2  ORF type:complete len:308 (-),score=66.49 GHVP01053116.1:1018-1941(-)